MIDNTDNCREVMLVRELINMCRIFEPNSRLILHTTFFAFAQVMLINVRMGYLTGLYFSGITQFTGVGF